MRITDNSHPYPRVLRGYLATRDTKGAKRAVSAGARAARNPRGPARQPLAPSKGK
jgi:hypothetical protein